MFKGQNLDTPTNATQAGMIQNTDEVILSIEE